MAVLNNPIRVPLTVRENRKTVRMGIGADREAVRFSGIGSKIVAGQYEAYTGNYIVTPDLEAQTLDTKGKAMADDVTVLAIPYAEVTNESGGYTATIGR